LLINAKRACWCGEKSRNQPTCSGIVIVVVVGLYAKVQEQSPPLAHFLNFLEESMIKHIPISIPKGVWDPCSHMPLCCEDEK